MLGVFYYGVNDLRVEEASEPKIKNADDVIVNVRASGICGSDIKTLHGEYDGNPPVILGHEFAGEVYEVGPNVKNVKKGDRVVVDPNLTCGTCYYCRRGYENICEKVITIGLHANGGLAKYCSLPSNALHKIPDWLPFDEAAVTEPLACVLNGLNRCQIKPGDTVGLIGLGPIGCLYLQLLKHSGASKIIAFELKQDRIDTAKRLGAEVIVNPSEPGSLENVKKMTDGGVNVAIEAVGSPAASKLALSILRRGGRLVVFGIQKPDSKIEIDAFQLTRYELEVAGSFIDRFTFLPAIQMIAEKKVDAKSLITSTFALAEAKKAFDLMEQGKGIKIQLKP